MPERQTELHGRNSMEAFAVTITAGGGFSA
jgi:hypothetical protein